MAPDVGNRVIDYSTKFRSTTETAAQLLMGDTLGAADVEAP